MGLKVIQCYAPMSSKNETIKVEFHNMLQKVLDKERDKDIIILMETLT
jgi:hypothetical protein